ncbi:MAG: hypothetical protein VBE63_13515 [Lamprobacter sp.]|uniref:hypothetical protein n=1 Tax=Lamprobacter sp. TaxID=3100796 RepID=UPI002B259A9F|nr:hypothetical protein [Lamprobacter sp.]MEA3640947.1 hypothetical protein [Lamprobacter sp.]
MPMISPSIPTISRRLHNGRLLLTPEDPMAAIPGQSLSGQLLDAGLIATAAPGNGMRFASGKRLFEYIGFTGCAVQFGSALDQTGRLAIEIEGPLDAPVLRYGRNSRPPRCAQCQRPLPTWREQIEQTNSGDERLLHCLGCGAEAPGWSWNWGRHGGFGRLFVNLEPVFPGEGRPLPALLTLLAQVELGPWRYFYVQD